MDKIIIEGINLYPLRHIEIPGGDIFHALKSSDDGYEGFGEAYFSQIKHKAIKGWKRHNKMTLNIIVPIGTIKFVIYDDRENSLTKGSFYEVTLSPESNYQRLTVASGLWMAFAGIAKNTSMLMNVIPQPHNQSEADNLDISQIAYNFNL